MNKNIVNNIKNLKGKKVLVRCDFNVPMKNSKIQDDTRIKGAIPTIKYLMDNGAKVILCSHLGKPKPKEMSKEEMKKKFSLETVANDLSKKLGTEVKFIEDLEKANEIISQLNDGEVSLLENTRFDVGETVNDESLSLKLANLADVFINDAFGTAHRAHSSTTGVAEIMEEQGKETAIGFLMQKEVENLSEVLENPKPPFVVILGGAKVADKIGVINNLMQKANKIIIGGKMANTFLKAQGFDIGSSGYEEDKLEIAKEIMENAKKSGVELILPYDVHIAKIPDGVELTSEVANIAEDKTVTVENGVPKGYTILDIGNETLNRYMETIGDTKREESANTIVWNGPLGYTESPKYAIGTDKIARYIATKTNAKCIIGGGDSVSAINKVKKEAQKDGEDMSMFDKLYLSTGGGASLEFLEGKELPGIKAIQNK